MFLWNILSTLNLWDFALCVLAVQLWLHMLSVVTDGESYPPSRVRRTLYLDVELLSGCAKSLEYIQCGIATVHVFSVEVALHEFTGLFFDPGFNLISENQRGERKKTNM